MCCRVAPHLFSNMEDEGVNTVWVILLHRAVSENCCSKMASSSGRTSCWRLGLNHTPGTIPDTGWELPLLANRWNTQLSPLCHFWFPDPLLNLCWLKPLVLLNPRTSLPRVTSSALLSFFLPPCVFRGCNFRKRLIKKRSSEKPWPWPWPWPSCADLGPFLEVEGTRRTCTRGRTPAAAVLDSAPLLTFLLCVVWTVFTRNFLRGC